ncbi:alpha-amylase [bacterium]|nr:MAG: alpha-amylase [bacterium]
MLLPLLPTLIPNLVPPLTKAVVYEANLRAEGPTGGFAALTKRLDSIEGLGVNVLWLMPIQPVGKLRSAGGLGSPYATADFDRINPEFGTEGEFKRLIAEAHRRKIAVIIDWVANHTAWDNPWIQAHPDWYTRDAKGEITIPAGTNWQDTADLNYDVPAVRTTMIASMKGWVERYGIDGFRFDTADWVPIEFWKEAVPALRRASPKPLFLLAEGFRRQNSQAGFDLEYGWPFYDELVKIFKGGKASSIASAAAMEHRNGLPHLRFVTNHDKAAWEGTPLDFFKSPGGVQAAALVSTLYEGGVPLVYSGQEVAWAKRIPFFDRSTIDWNDSPETARWLSRLHRLRSANPAFQTGSTTDLSSDDAIAFIRRKGSDEAFVVANVRDHAVSLPIAVDLRGNWTEAMTARPVSLSESIEIPAYGSRVFLRKSGRSVAAWQRVSPSLARAGPSSS